MIEGLIAFDSFHLFLLLLALVWKYRKRRKPLSLLVPLCLWAFLCSSPIVHNVLLKHLEGEFSRPTLSTQRQNSNVVVVLTSGYVLYQHGTLQPRLDEHGWERLYTAVNLWHKTGGTFLISGNLRWGHGASIASAMSRVAQRMGVPRQAIVLDESSETTWQSMQYLAASIDTTKQRLFLVTSAYHMPRAALMAEFFAVDAIHWAGDFLARDYMRARSWLPSPRVDMLLVFHEYIGLAYYRFKLWWIFDVADNKG